MALPYATTAADLAPVRTLSGDYPETTRTDASAVSWGPILAGGGAIAEHRAKQPTQEAAMRSLILLFLGIPIPIIILIALFVR